ncbi:cell division protein FtsQ [Kineobactrum sediminis]|uniref:Cell division protein FtsQ n=1 Tax=Kineobactrum sediminis TaxID=1905677 RepID=A0A2N5Y3H3_9GAMM|nr:cell division protein FtsQ/DivIB [Kineobactrum sediminis]PLW82940.1 cell division protein FtsQ [Kineobactrum sediminis]
MATRPESVRRRNAAAGATRRKPAAPAATRLRPGMAVLDGWVNRLLILVGSAVVIAAGLQAWFTLQQIPVEQITVTGSLQRTQTELVQEMVQPALVGGFLGADLGEVRDQLEALPWIYRASVRRRWPNALEIHVLEQLPIAHWGDNGFLNHEGQVFQSDSVQAGEALPRLRGPEGAAGQLMVSYQQLGELLKPVNLAVLALTLDKRGHLSAVLEGGIALALGNTDFAERVQRFTTVYARELAARPGEVERVDLRYERGLAVAFREPVELAVVVNE